MAGVENCGLCGVPRYISSAFEWGDNGVISLPTAPGERMVFYEAETIDALFAGIRELLGIPIDNIIIESRRRETRRYMEGMFPRQVVDLVRSDTEEAEAESRGDTGRHYNLRANMIGKLYGYGHIELSEGWEDGTPRPWRVQYIRDPYSLPFFMADTLGTVEAIEGVDLWVESEDLGGGLFRITVKEGKHPVELDRRLRRRRYDFKPGDISLRRCHACGVPLDVARCAWNPEQGVILDPITGKRMVFFGSAAMDAVLDDLRNEVGDSVPRAAIEAQRRLIKSYLSGDDWRRRGRDMRQVAALYGLGNITRFEAERDRVGMTIENSCLHLPTAGVVWALVDLEMGFTASTCEWDLADDGDLNITVAVL